MIPDYIKKYFWEVDTNDLDPKKWKIYILTRLLEYGSPKAISWAWKSFSKKDWIKALKSREISLITKNFWLPILSKKK